MRTSLLAALIAAFVVSSSASAQFAGYVAHTTQLSTWDKKILRVYYKDRRKLGGKAVGRNIIIRGYKGRGVVRPPTLAQKARFMRELKKLAHPALPYFVRTAAPPRQPPAGTMAAGVTPGSLAQCIITSESHGDPTASNGSHSGIAAWSADAWKADGGLAYASTPTGATYQEQEIVLSQGLARYGCSQWCPFDPC